MAEGTAAIIKEKLDVVEFLKQYLTLTPAGKNFKALCPFHHEKTPSFMVSPERQTWHCFGCALGGDVFTFLMRYENLEFNEALKLLAEKTGVELRRTNPQEYKFAGLLYDLNDAAKDFFKQNLASANVSKHYLKERGLTDNTVETFDLGWAGNEPDALTLHLINCGYDPTDIVRAGLIIKTERGMLRDRFRGRIMFPIMNHVGKTVGFTGRILPQLDTGDMGKYVNSPESPIFNKSKLLYGFYETKNNIRDAGAAFLVEGQMDFLMSWQAGIRNVVATSGTALTTEHLRTLRRFVTTVYMSFDSDEAGQAGSLRAIDLAEASELAVKVVQLGNYKDPADAALADPGALKDAILHSIPAMEFYFDRYLPRGDYDPRDRKSLVGLREVLRKIKIIASPVEQAAWLKDLSRRIGIDEAALRAEIERVEDKVAPRSHEEEEVPAAERAPASHRERVMQRFLSVLAARNDFGPLTEEFERYLTPFYVKTAELLKQGMHTSLDQDIDECLNLIMLQAEDAPPAEFEDLKRYLVFEYYRERRNELVAALRQAEIEGSKEEADRLLGELKNLPVTPV